MPRRIAVIAAFEAFLAEAERLQAVQEEFFDAGSIGLWEPQNRIGYPSPPGDIELDSFEAAEPGNGWGAVAMRLVAALADRHAVSVFLQAHSEFLDIPPAASIIDGDEEWDHPQDRLVGFYRRHGFVVLHDQGDTVDMIRHPRAPDPEGQAALDRALNGEPLDWPGRSRNPAP